MTPTSSVASAKRGAPSCKHGGSYEVLHGIAGGGGPERCASGGGARRTRVFLMKEGVGWLKAEATRSAEWSSPSPCAALRALLIARCRVRNADARPTISGSLNEAPP